LIQYGYDIEDIQISKIEDTVIFLQRIKGLIDSYQRDIKTINTESRIGHKMISSTDVKKFKSVSEYKEMTSAWRIEREQILNQVTSLKVKRTSQL
jgi:hypothetical protein